MTKEQNNPVAEESNGDELLTAEKEKRFVAQIDFYVYANSDEEAKQKAEAICKGMRNEQDNHATLNELVEQPFGTLGNRKINL